MVNSLVSIIIPIYKVEKYLQECLDSVINQTYRNLEIILIDDGSPDKCGDICDEYAKKDARIKVIHKKNAGVSSARNDGIKIATGEWIMFVDSDDIIDLTMVEVFVNAVSNSDCDMVIGACRQFSKDFDRTFKCFQKKIYCVTDYIKYYSDNLLNGILNSPCGRMYRASIVKRNSFPPDITYGEDLVFNAHILCDINKIISVGEDTVYHYRMRKSSAVNTLSLDLNIVDQIKVTLEKANGGSSKYIDKFIQHQYYATNLVSTIRSLSNGKYKRYLSFSDLIYGITKMPKLKSKVNVFILYFFPFLYLPLKKLALVTEVDYYE